MGKVRSLFCPNLQPNPELLGHRCIPWQRGSCWCLPGRRGRSSPFPGESPATCNRASWLTVHYFAGNEAAPCQAAEGSTRDKIQQWKSRVGSIPSRGHLALPSTKELPPTLSRIPATLARQNLTSHWQGVRSKQCTFMKAVSDILYHLCWKALAWALNFWSQAHIQPFTYSRQGMCSMYPQLLPLETVYKWMSSAAVHATPLIISPPPPQLNNVGGGELEPCRRLQAKGMV